VSSDQKTHHLCRYRLEQAEEALSEADLLLNAGHFRGAINRAYYAMFYAIQILVVKNKVKVSKHSGVISYFDREFVKPGIIDKEFSKWLHRLFDLRQDADYGICLSLRMINADRQWNRPDNLFIVSATILKVHPIVKICQKDSISYLYYQRPLLTSKVRR